jgi:hypothetical protein
MLYKMTMYSFVPPFREAKFCGVSSCVFDKLGCAASEKRLWNTGLSDIPGSCVDSAHKPNSTQYFPLSVDIFTC